MAKDNEFPATHAMVLSSRSKRTSEFPSQAAQRMHVQSPSDTNPIQQVGPPKLSHGNDQPEPLRSNPASTPQRAVIIESKGYQLIRQLLRREQMARPSVALTIPLRIYLVRISELPSAADILKPHWSKPQVVRTNENPYGIWVGCTAAILRVCPVLKYNIPVAQSTDSRLLRQHPNTQKIRQMMRDSTLPLPTPRQTLQLQQLLNGHEASSTGSSPHTQII